MIPEARGRGQDTASVEADQLQSAIMNILEDATIEQRHVQAAQRATVNILEDFDRERSRLADVQRAVLNILGDAAEERLELKGTQRAAQNILEDLSDERARAVRANEDLTAEVAKRTTAERHLEAKAAALTAANEEMETFTYSVSHDLRAPLRALDGFSEALLEDHARTLDAEGVNFLHLIRTSAQHMADLIDALLTVSHLARIELERRPLDLTALCTDVAEELGAAAPGRAVDVRIQPGAVVTGDAKLLRLVLQNLIGNAWKFTGKTPAARIEVTHHKVPGAVEVTVRDNGAGFDMLFADRLFTPFQRLHQATDFPGTGIGLTIVHRILARHGGTIRAQGAPGEGARFTFTLPEAMP